MGKSCAIIPRVRNSKGEKTDSKLFKDLLSFLPSRAEARKVYLITKNNEFINNFIHKLNLDENGEPTIKSLLDKTSLNDFVNDEKILNVLNRQIGYNKKDQSIIYHERTEENYKELQEKADRFNNTSDFRKEYIAKVDKTSNIQGKPAYTISVAKRTEELEQQVQRNSYNNELNNQLRDILRAVGINVGVLTEAEERMQLNGVADFDTAERAANGFITLIRLAKGQRGEQALPEEFAHIALRVLSNNPLVQRLYNIIRDNGLAKEILGEDYEIYNEKYHENTDKLAEEAAGKLLAKHLTGSQQIPTKPYRNILQRIIDAIKSFFKRFDETPFQKAMIEADKGYGKLAKTILENSLVEKEADLNALKNGGVLYSTSKHIKNTHDLIKQILRNEVKRRNIYAKRTKNPKFSEKQQQLIDQLETDIKKNNDIEGIYSYLENTLGILTSLETRLKNINGKSLQDKAKILRDVRNYIYSYKGITDDLLNIALNETEEGNKLYDRAIEDINKVTSQIKILENRYNKLVLPMIMDMFRPILGESITVPFGKYKGKTFTLEDMLTTAETDITLADRWLDSMADSTSPILKGIDQIVKRRKEEARFNTIEIEKRIKAAAVKAERAGVKNFDFMYEKDGNNYTGYYISEINRGKYEKAKKKFFDELNEKYKDELTEQQQKTKKEDIAIWYSKNTTKLKDGTSMPNLSIYGNPEFNRMTSAQRTFYNEMMKIKEDADLKLPINYTTLHNTIKIRKSLIERLKTSKNPGKQLWENIKDGYLERSDDTEFGTKATLVDFEGHTVNTIPIYYTKLREGESNNDVSRDIVSTMTAYVAMAEEYNQMNKVIDALEVAKTYFEENLTTRKRSGTDILVEKIKTAFNKGEEEQEVNIKPKKLLDRLDSFFDMQIYGRMQKEEGSFNFFGYRISKAKFANRLTKLNVVTKFALNTMAGMSNATTGNTMGTIEAISREFFTPLNLLKADKNYTAAMPACVANMGARIKNDKLSLFDELFNVLQDYERDVKEVDWVQGRVARLLGPKMMYLTNSVGEHWLQNRTALALADAYKMKDTNGKIVSLWDALEVVPLDLKDPSLGSKLQIKEGYTKEDGSKFTRDDIYKFSRKSAMINERMHGIYNEADRNAIKQYAAGRMAMLYRNWMRPSWNKRFQRATYNYDAEAWTEGYYQTFFRFSMDLIKELKESQLSITANWNNLTLTEKANIRRAITEIATFIMLALALGFIEWPDDDDDNSWFMSTLEYQTRRLYSEIGALTPTPAMLREGLKILNSPSADIQTLQSILNLLGLFNPYNYETFAGDEALLQSGRFKGESRATKIIYESPITGPYNTIYRGLHPEEGIAYFKNGLY